MANLLLVNCALYKNGLRKLNGVHFCDGGEGGDLRLMINVIGWSLKSLIVLRGGESHLCFCFF